jgi:hypothetical protein
MLLIFGLLITAAVLILTGSRVPRRPDSTRLGWMSQRWLNEYRASHLT